MIGLKKGVVDNFGFGNESGRAERFLRSPPEVSPGNEVTLLTIVLNSNIFSNFSNLTLLHQDLAIFDMIFPFFSTKSKLIYRHDFYKTLTLVNRTPSKLHQDFDIYQHDSI